jgi:DNA-binding NtrC family response regulator
VNRSILIVDDDSRIRTSLSEVLEDGNTDVRTAEHAEAALEWVIRQGGAKWWIRERGSGRVRWLCWPRGH